MNINIQPDVFNKTYIPHLKNNKPIQIYFGGSSSGKSVFVCQRTVIHLLLGHRNYLIVRNTRNSIKGSIFNELVKIINNWSLQKYFKINHSELIITCIITNKQCLFRGLDDSEKIKSITPVSGVITDIIVEEATETRKKDIKQLEKRLRGKSKVPKTITLLFNPIMKSHWLYKEYFEGKFKDKDTFFSDDNISILKTTYKDNKFLTEQDIQRLENEKDQYWYNVYTLGLWGTINESLIYNYELVDTMPDTKDSVIGIDFGFGTSAIVEVLKAGDDIYLNELLYIHKATNSDLIDYLNDNISKDKIIVGDSAEPDRITEIRKQNFQIRPANKGKGSVNNGIDYIKRHNLYVTSGSSNLINELDTYSWKTNKDDIILDEPIKFNDHACDAFRYAIYTLYYKPRSILSITSLGDY